MRTTTQLALVTTSVVLVAVFVGIGRSQQPTRPSADAVQEAQTARDVPLARPEQRKTEHDRSTPVQRTRALVSGAASSSRTRGGRPASIFARDPHNAKRPMQTFEEGMKADVAEKPAVMAAQRRLLESRYDLTPRLDPSARMSRGKPLAVGPTARLRSGVTWERLATMTPEEIRSRGLFPYPSLPHPKHATGGQVFPQMQIAMFPRLERFDVEFDLPEAFLPEFPPAIFLQNRPELGDVSRGEVVSINNFHRLFKDLVTPGAARRPAPAGHAASRRKSSIATDDRKTAQPSLGVTCLDCHVNGHTTGQFHLNPDNRPQERRFRLDTTSLRGVFNQQIHGSKRSLRSVEDFTEFEQRTAYFNGDPIHAMKKGMNILDRIQVSHMAQMQNMFDFPPAPKLDVHGPARSRREPPRASGAARRCSSARRSAGACHPAPFYLDHQMHDLEARAIPRRAPARPHQDLHAAGHQGQPALPARWAGADAGGHRGVLQPRAEPAALGTREGRPRGIHAAALSEHTPVVSGGFASARGGKDLKTTIGAARAKKARREML